MAAEDRRQEALVTDPETFLEHESGDVFFSPPMKGECQLPALPIPLLLAFQGGLYDRMRAAGLQVAPGINILVSCYERKKLRGSNTILFASDTYCRHMI